MSDNKTIVIIFITTISFLSALNSGILVGSKPPLNFSSSDILSNSSHYVDVNVIGSGSVILIPDQAYYSKNSTIMFNAMADPGYVFTGWSGDLEGIVNPRLIEIDDNKTVTATFTEFSLLINASAGAGGSISSSGMAIVGYGGSQEFVISPNPGFHTVDVLLDGKSLGPKESYLFTGVTSEHTIAASFEADSPVTWTISTSASMGGTISPSGQVVVGDGESQYFTITPDAGYHISNVFLDGLSVGHVSSFTFSGVASEHTIVASFAFKEYSLTVNVGGEGSVVLSPAGGVYDVGTVVDLTATADSGYEFTGWSEDLSGLVNPESITMTANKAVTATFTEKAPITSSGPIFIPVPPTQYTLTVNTVGNGAVTLSPAGGLYDEDTEVSLTPVADSGYVFTGWSGALSGSTNPASITMNSDETVTATFTAIQYTLTVNTVGSGSVSKTPNQATYTSGSSVQLTATPDPGYVFTGWSGDLSGSANPESLTMNGNKGVTATFTEIPPTYEISFLRYDNFHNYVYESGTPSEYDGYAIAEELDFYVGRERHSLAIPGMLAAGKDILCYRDINTQTPTLPGYNPSWNLLNSEGEFVVYNSYLQIEVVDPLNEEYRAFLIEWIQAQKDQGFTGIFLDNGIQVDVPTKYVLDSHPINPRTGQLYTDADYVNDCLDILNWVKLQFPDMYFMANGFWSGNLYNQQTASHQYIIQNLEIDAIFAEGMFCNMNGIIWSSGDWKSSVDFLHIMQDDWISKGKSFVTSSKMGPASRAEQNVVGVIGLKRVTSYMFCSALLAVDNIEGNILGMNRASSTDYVQDLYNTSVGYAVGDYYRSGNIYTREWSKVYVFVNPFTSTESIDVSGMGLYDEYGNLQTTVSMPALSGLILYKTS